MLVVSPMMKARPPAFFEGIVLLELIDYCNEVEYSPETRKFISDFYGSIRCEARRQVPSQALLGYSSARYLLTNLQDNKGVFTPGGERGIPKGIAVTFMFVTAVTKRLPTMTYAPQDL